MARYLWCWPIRNGKTQQLVQGWEEERRKRNDPNYMKHVEAVWENIGLHDYNMWIQHTHKGDYWVNMVEADDWNSLWENFAEAIRDGNPHAVSLHKLWLDALGIDFSQAGALPEAQLLGENMVGRVPENKIFSQAFCFPIKKGHEQGRHAFQQSLKSERAKQFKQACEEIGLSSIARYLMKTPDGSFYIVYQEFNIDNFEKVHDFLTNPKTRQRHSWAWEGLVEDSGWSMEQLIPHLDYLRQKPPVGIKS